MRRSIQLLAVFLLLLFASAIRAQTPVNCGIVDIDGPSTVEPGTSVVFKVKITGPIHTTKPEFKWNLSVGTIMTGQGTDEITVDTVGLGGQDVIITVELSGAPRDCRALASRTMQVTPAPIACGKPFDLYGDIKFEDEEARLDNFAIQLMNQPLAATGTILLSAGKETYHNEARERLDRIKSYLVDVREIDPVRIVTIDCGFDSILTTTLYIVPPGIAPPQCINNAIPFSEVKFTKPRPKPRK
jgi:hypothetical protein